MRCLVHLILCLWLSALCTAEEHGFEMYDNYDRHINRKAYPDYLRNDVHRMHAIRARKSNVNRQELVSKTLAEAAGVYLDKERGKSMGLEKSVIISVISYPKVRAHYIKYLRNFICFTHSYEYDLVVYVARSKGDDYPAHMKQVQELKKLGVRALPFPEELFWWLVYGKANPVMEGRKHATWVGDTPDFLGYGALPMLVPTYEVIKSGYTCLYLDIDIALITDPVPHMTLGDADFSASMENRQCEEHLYGRSALSHAWDAVEPNTGVMVMRPTEQGISFMTKWLEEIVDLNAVNDQQVFDRTFRRKLNMTYTSNCLPPSAVGVIPDIPSKRINPRSATYCLLSDILFQNGMTALSCTHARHEGTYSKNMIEGGIPGSALKGPDYAPYAEPTAPGSAMDVKTGETNPLESQYFMATVHVNFSGGKSDELDKRGLWLFDESSRTADKDEFMPQAEPFAPHNRHSPKLGPQDGLNLDPAKGGIRTPHLSCKNYNISGSHYAKMLDFKRAYLDFVRWTKEFHAEVAVAGKLVKRESGRAVYLVSNDTKSLHAFPNGETFMKMGYDFGNVRDINTAVFEMFLIGDDLPDLIEQDLNVEKPKSSLTMRLEHTQSELRDDPQALFIIFGEFSSPNIRYNDTRYGRNPDEKKQY